jgi:hypothetical protein
MAYEDVLRAARSSQDGSLQRHVMRGELPKVGDTVPQLSPAKR